MVQGLGLLADNLEETRAFTDPDCPPDLRP
jgi:hypothetical protein